MRVLSPHLPETSHRPLCHVPLGQACRAALPAATGQGKDQHINGVGFFSRELPPTKPEVHRGFKCEGGPRLLFHVLTTLRLSCFNWISQWIVSQQWAEAWPFLRSSTTHWAALQRVKVLKKLSLAQSPTLPGLHSLELAVVFSPPWEPSAGRCL